MTDWQLGLQAFREGRMREAADRLQAAQDEHELAVSLAARYETSAYLGAALYALGLPVEALTAFEQAVQFSPSGMPAPDLQMNLAHAYLAAGRREEARQTLRSLLSVSPGHVAANMLATRLDTSAPGTAVSGTVLGSSPESAQSYIRTLKFTRSGPSGYDAAEVQEALTQLGRYINGLTQELAQAEAVNDRQEMELLRYRQMEDAVIENMMQQSPQHHSENSEEAEGALSPIEILFRQKS